jgi:epoxyqueuosine reductase
MVSLPVEASEGVLEFVARAAAEVGFARCGIAAASPADHFDRFTDWLERGYAGSMAYLQTHHEARRVPTSILPSVQSVIMLLAPYTPTKPGVMQENHGRVARYAQGPDYHRTLWDWLDQLLLKLQTRYPGLQGRGVVDTAPLLERDFARRAGLGWFGKNTMLISPKIGSYFFIAALLVDAAWPATTNQVRNHCGQCTACIEACPTTAILPGGWLDARRCLSYHTIEQRGETDAAFRADTGDWLFGCDICQEVCPWNRFAPPGVLPHDETLVALDAITLLTMDEQAYRQRFRGTALARAKRSGLRRNAAIVLGNTGTAACRPALVQASGDEDAVVAEAARWALARFDARHPSTGLEQGGEFPIPRGPVGAA